MFEAFLDKLMNGTEKIADQAGEGSWARLALIPLMGLAAGVAFGGIAIAEELKDWRKARAEQAKKRSSAPPVVR